MKAKKGKVQENDIMPQLVDYLMINKEVALANDFQNGKDIILKLSHPLQKSGANLLASVLKTNTKNIITLDLGGLNIKSPELTKLLTSLKSNTTVREIKVYDRDLRNASAIIKKLASLFEVNKTIDTLRLNRTLIFKAKNVNELLQVLITKSSIKHLDLTQDSYSQDSYLETVKLLTEILKDNTVFTHLNLTNYNGMQNPDI